MLGELRGEFESEGWERGFERLRGFLIGEEPRLPYQEVAAALSTSVPAVKTAVHRLRHRLVGVVAPWGARAS